MKAQTYASVRRAFQLELALIVTIIVVLMIARLVLGYRAVGGYTMLATAALSAVMAAGIVYWRIRTVPRRRPSSTQLSFLYLVGLAAVLAYPVAFLVGLIGETLIYSWPDAVIAIPVYILSVIAFIHHGLVKLVRSETDQQARAKRRQVTARWMRELSRAERRTGAKP